MCRLRYTGILWNINCMNDDDLKLTAERVDAYALEVLPPPRYQHSLRVALLARDLCLKFGINPLEGYLAGIAHDMCKACNDRWLLSTALMDDCPISPIERDKPSLLHGRAAAVVLRTDFSVDSRSVIEAVRHHTFGAPGLDTLGKIIFVSDKIEPGRTGIEDAFRKKILESGLDDMTALVLEDNVRYLESRGKLVSDSTNEMLLSLKRRGEAS